MSAPKLDAQAIVVRRGPHVLLDGVTVSVRAGELVAFLGPNGAGKTTLLRVLAGLDAPAAGEVHLGGVPFAAVGRGRMGREIAYLAQAGRIHWPMTVASLVGLGRLPHPGDPAADAVAVERAMADADVLPLRARLTSTLSGGERMRVLLARALAVEAPVLLADEPLAALDPLHQIATMELLRAEARRGVAVVAVLHDLTFAARYCDRCVLMRGGRIEADGPPAEVLTEARLQAIYDVRVARAEIEGTPVLLPWARSAPPR